MNMINHSRFVIVSIRLNIDPVYFCGLEVLSTNYSKHCDRFVHLHRPNNRNIDTFQTEPISNIGAFPMDVAREISIQPLAHTKKHSKHFAFVIFQSLWLLIGKQPFRGALYHRDCWNLSDCPHSLTPHNPQSSSGCNCCCCFCCDFRRHR